MSEAAGSDSPRTARDGSGRHRKSGSASSSSARRRLPAHNAQQETAAEAKNAQPTETVNIWDLALKTREKDRTATQEERHMVVCGSSGGGMSTILRRFLERQDTPKPTVALEYTFGRYAKGHDRHKDIVHIWELGGGASLANLLDTPINHASLRSLSVVVVLDLSKPASLWHTAATLLSSIHARIEGLLSELESRGSKVPAYMRKKMWQRYAGGQVEKELVTPLAVPLVILGSKYDVFRDMESEKRKMACRALRFLAHIYGGTLLFVSQRDESLMNRCRALLADLAFKVPYKSSSTSFDHNKPLIVPVGTDTLANVGAPPAVASATSGSRTPLGLWKGAMDSLFPPVTAGDDEDMPSDPCLHPDHREPMVDEVRAQKDEELARMRKRAERRARASNRASGDN